MQHTIRCMETNPARFEQLSLLSQVRGISTGYSAGGALKMH